MSQARWFLVIFLAAAAALYGGLCVLLFVSQRSLIYFPTGSSGAVDTMRMQVGGELVLVSTRPQDGVGAVLYFGGNAEDVSLSLPDLEEAFPGRALYLMHYPGYGGSSGRPSEKAIAHAALALFDHVHAQYPDVVVVGRSLGSGVAAELASQRPVSRLVLVTPFDSLVNVAAFHYPIFPVRLLLRDRYESCRYAATIAAPVKIVAAAEDEVVPAASTERLRGCFRPGALTDYIVVPGVGHNTISDSKNYPVLLR